MDTREAPMEERMSETKFKDTSVLGDLYRNPNLSPEALERELAEVEAEEAAQAQALIDAADAQKVEEELDKENPLNKAQKHDYEKRYKDLQRYMSKKDKEHEEEKSRLREQLEERDVSLPKSAEELEKFRETYPDMYKTIETVAGLKSKEATEAYEKRLAEVEAREQEASKKEALVEVKRVHEDLEDIASSEDFVEWINSKTETGSTWVRDAAFGTAAQPVIDVVSLYKREKGIEGPKKRGRPRKNTDVDAGASKVPTSRSEEPGGASEKVYTADDISKMSDEEFLELDSKGAFR